MYLNHLFLTQLKVQTCFLRMCKLTMLIYEHDIIQGVVLCFRGAVECIRAISNATAETSGTEVVERLMAACETLRLSADSLTKFNFGQQAAEAHRDCAYGLRSGHCSAF